MRKTTRRHFLRQAGAGAALLSAGAAWGQAAGRRPNVLVILADDLGYGDLSCCGAPDMQTPHIDALARDGMRFTRFYANCPVCSPTRAALLTGRYPDLVGVPGVIRTHRNNSWGHLAPDATLFPEVMGRAGYHTALVGKWHLGLDERNTPNARGFDFFHGFLGDMMDDYYTHRRHEVNYMRRNTEEIDPEGHATDLFSTWACDYIRERAREPQPFFLYLAYNAPHTPIQPPEDWVARVQQREPDMDEDRAKLVALIEHMDDGIGRVLNTLDEAGIRDDTLVVFASDNGGLLRAGANNGPLRSGKQSMYEGGIRVPMCARWPERIPAGRTSEHMALTMDILPTVAECCGVPCGIPMDGRSLASVLEGGKPDAEERTLFWVRREGGGKYGGRAYYAARRGPWKLVQDSPFEPMQLYNLETDPAEANPVEDRPREYRMLWDALQDHINRSGAVPWEPDMHVSRE